MVVFRVDPPSVEQKATKGTKVMAKKLTFEELFKQFQTQLDVLHHRWMIHRHVYLAGGDVIDLLNQVAPEALGTFENASEDSIILQIGRFCDDNSTGEVISMNGLLSLLPNELQSISAVLKEVRDDTRERYVKAFCQYRHNVLAHANGWSIAGKAELPSYSEEDVRGVLAGLDTFGKKIDLAAHGRSLIDYGAAPISGGVPLINAIRSAKRLADLAREAERGKLSAEDALAALEEYAKCSYRVRLLPVRTGKTESIESQKPL
jgi:hypothetical protein